MSPCAVSVSGQLFQVYLCSHIIFNGVCVNWVGFMDLETLTGKARLAYNEEMAKVQSNNVWLCVVCMCVCIGRG